MPGFKAHLFGGALFFGLVLTLVLWLGVYQPDHQTLMFLALIALLSALFPDVDTDSKGRVLFYGALLAVYLVLMIQGRFRLAAILGFCALLPAVGHHRGWTHSWWAMFLVPLPIIILPMVFYDRSLVSVVPFYLASVTGYCSHLALDRTF
ncbi:LexA-binding, inner membrane-associated putative hydrolase [Desulfonatronum thiosulfatophilum]|uniref:LexA-binding, inner membrane-associated putative hydrolase n=1 Tax=Desulfonatronum thiosulfatophilum TaxID=617002 RepID=A0A1G6CC45_9BACT|nr:metal-dependent hydrolase [Desulfonatronum thiosulfatophilum]SDB30458.1 LexA-binding, inner membrane-associated putative hydrolase [Desulfonatronum thiosulfatophilum]